jgi:hypothetical protein
MLTWNAAELPELLTEARGETFGFYSGRPVAPPKRSEPLSTGCPEGGRARKCGLSLFFGFDFFLTLRVCTPRKPHSHAGWALERKKAPGRWAA